MVLGRYLLVGDLDRLGQGMEEAKGQGGGGNPEA